MSSPVRPGDRRASVAQSPSANTTSVKVVVRIRPTTSADAASVPQRFQRVVVQPISETALQADNPSPSASGAGKHAKQLFTFDRVVGPEEGQSRVYESAASLVDAYLAGYNATVLAYGQTSSGKSYTMGTDRIQEEATDDPSRQGITPRAVADIFARLKQAQQDANGALTFTAKVSYVEIYNEDLIDLLAGDVGVRPTVQIREDKQGRIFWSGLREIKVSSAAEVMNLLAAGSALRQTGATDMNAQSSRSHAIFSLTVTQQRWSGAGPPPATPPPTTPASPTHNRRLSALPRMSSPAPGGRPGTPSSDRPASRFGLRPPSTGGRPSSPQGEEAAGSWTNMTSKFHFVDLAGSERLKRTAAAGERAKEGISINAGLSALGNVISALGDPTKKATHIPYRDSKLTRLLQDSLGGNARTMMIACISPAEFNLHETLSTLKYANRARNIKNRAEVNESEAGWDDLVYLQRTIVKLRAELATIKAGDLDHLSNEGDNVPAGTGDVFDASLQQRVALLTAELAKAQAVTPSQGDQPATSLSRDQFAAAVEPIVEEYERSLSALESQLALTRAALGHSEEEMRDLEHRIEEEAKANQVNEALIEELRNRVAKLTERESTTEAYVRDIESKLKEVDEAGEAHGSAMSDLRRELAKGREQTLSTEMYIKELEARLAEADTATAALRRQIETLERDVMQREEAHRELEARIALLDNSSETKLLIAEIDEKDRRLSDLERSLDDAKANANEARAEISRLQQVADSEKAEKDDLLGRVRTLEHNGPRQDLSMATRRPAEAQGTVEDPNIGDLAELQAAHEQTVRELEEARQKYRDALKEIEDLHGQAQEARLLRSPPSISELSERTTSTEGTSRQRPRSEDSAEDEVGHPGESPSTLRTAPRTPTARRSVPLADQHGLSFRSRGHGASSPSHLRWASLQQELSSAASFQNSCPTSPGSTLPLASSPLGSSPSRPGTSVGPTERSYDQLKEEIRKLQEVLQQRDDEISTLENTLHQQLHTPATTPSLGDSPLASFSPLPDQPDTPPRPSVIVDDGLLSPRTVARFDSLRSDFVSGNGLGLSPAAATVKPLSAESQTRLDELMMSMAAKERAHREIVEKLDAEIMSLRRANDELTILSRDQAENMAAEIDALRAASAKMQVDRAEFEQLQSKVAASEEAYAALERRSQSQAKTADADAQNSLASLEASHKAALDDLRGKHARILETELATARQERLEEQIRDLSRHQTDAEELAKQHAETTATAVAEAIAQLRQEHTATIHELTAQLQAMHSDKTAADLADHAKEVEKLIASHESAVSGLKDEHAERLRIGEEERARLYSELETVEATLREVRDQLAAAEQSRQDEIAATLEKHEHALLTLRTQLAADHDKAMSEQQDAHDAALAEAASARELSESMWKEESARGFKDRLDRLRAEHQAASAAAEATLRETHAAELERQQARIEVLETTTTSLESAASAHQASIESIKSEHAQVLESLNSEHAQSIEAQEVQSQRDLEELSATHEETTRALQIERDRFRELVESLSEEVGTLKQELSALQERTATMARDHEGVVTAAAADAEARGARNDELAAEVDNLQRQQATESERLRAIAAADLSAAEERHASALTELQEEHDRAIKTATNELEAATKELAESRRQLREQLETSAARHQSEIELLEKAHADKLDTVRADHEQALRVVREEAAVAGDAAAQEHESLRVMQASLADKISALQKEVGGVRQELEGTIAERDALADRLDQLASQQASTADAHAQEVNSLRQKLRLQDSFVTAKSRQSSDLQEALQALDALQEAFGSQSEECARLRGPTQSSDHTSNGSEEGSAHTKDSAVATDLTRYRDLITRLDQSLAVAVKEKEALARQLARMSLSSASAFAGPPANQPPSRPLSPFNELPSGPAPPVVRAEHFLSNASQFNAKMPPPTRPPSIPPPPAPEAGSAKSSRSSETSTSVAQVQGSSQQAEALELARLQKELAQREADLQAQRDLVNTLESALNDSERNLRKARQTSIEHARERDQYRETAERLERAVAEAQSASEKYRQSMVDLEERLQEQRTREARAARARLELEARMYEANKRKSKFACF